MMKIWSRLWTVLLFTTISNLAPIGPAYAQTFDPLKRTDALVAITAERNIIDPNGVNRWAPISSGTGFIVTSSGYVITARHNFPNCLTRKECDQEDPPLLAKSVIMNGDQVRIWGHVRDRYGSPMPLIPIEMSASADFILLKLARDDSYSFFPIGEPQKVAHGHRLLILGFPKDQATSWPFEGRYAGADGPKGSWKVGVPTGQGMSGGPVFDLQSGGVVGMIYGGVKNSFPPLGYVHPINHGVNLLNIAGAVTVDELVDQRKGVSSGNVTKTEVGKSKPNKSPLKTVSFSINRTKDDHPKLTSPTSKSFKEVFQADKGYKFTDAKFRLLSANNHSGLVYRIEDKGKRLVVEYSLKSGPAIDRWRGWINADVVATQAPER